MSSKHSFGKALCTTNVVCGEQIQALLSEKTVNLITGLISLEIYSRTLQHAQHAPIRSRHQNINMATRCSRRVRAYSMDQS